MRGAGDRIRARVPSGRGLWVDGTGLVLGRHAPAAQVARRGIVSSAKRKMSCPQHDVGK